LRLAAVVCIFGVKCGWGGQGELLDDYNSREDTQYSHISHYDISDETAKLVPEEGFDYRNSNANLTCGSACSYSILGVAGIASFLALRATQQRPRASSRRGLDVVKLQDQIQQAREKINEVSEKIEYAWEVSGEIEKKRKTLPTDSERRRETNRPGLLDNFGKRIKHAMKYAGEKEKKKSKKAYRTRKRGPSIKQRLQRVGDVVEDSMQMVNPLNPFKFWMNILNPAPISSRKKSRNRFERKRSKSKSTLDFAYRKKKYPGSYRTINEEVMKPMVEENITNEKTNFDNEIENINKPGYFGDTYKKNKKLIEKENKMAAAQEVDDHELKKSIDANIKNGFDLIFDKNFKKPWGKIHEPKKYSAMDKIEEYRKYDDNYVYDEYLPYYDNKY